jgi:hypothetical protein
MDILKIAPGCEEFEWDEHNSKKIWQKHRVSPSECEQIFFHQPLVVADDEKHSDQENRFYALGWTNNGRRIFAVFTVRGKKIRVITARDMSQKERKLYEEQIRKETEIQG